MRVLILSLSYRGGGAQRCARELFEWLPGLGIETQMWVGERSPSDPAGVVGLKRSWEQTLGFLEAMPHWTDWRHVESRRRLDRIEPGDFDVVHIHVLHGGYTSVKAVHRLCQRIPSVWTFHDEWPVTGGSCYHLGDRIDPWEVKRMTSGVFRYVPYHSYHDNFRFLGLRRFLDRWMPQPAAIISPSRYLLELAEASRRFPAARFHRIPNAVALGEQPDANMCREQARRTFNLMTGRPVILLVAANIDEPRKGMALAVDAIHRIASSHGEIQVLVLGKSTGRIAAALHNFPVVATYAGDDATLARAYRAADVTLIPSLADNLPYVALESLACATPVVAFRVGGLTEIVGDDERGLLAKAYDVDALARAVVTLLRNQSLRAEMGRAGREWVDRECNVTNYLAAVKSVYDAVRPEPTADADDSR